MFTFEKSDLIPLATSDAKLRIYRLKESDFRVIFIRIPGPLVSTSIIVPTLSKDNSGLPHTLEVS
jgi:Zn-dependent M16 (insulinase) family peptidase